MIKFGFAGCSKHSSVMATRTNLRIGFPQQTGWMLGLANLFNLFTVEFCIKVMFGK